MRLRYGMVGGGVGSFIGDVHRHGAEIDDLAILVCGCFSRNPQKNRQTALNWHLEDPDRIYADYKEMAQKEAARTDGIDFVTIATPNASHYEIAKCFMEHGIHVMCDKPLSLTVDQALDLQKIVKERNIRFGVTYAYTGYPAIRQAREMIRAGEIGDILHVRVSHPEDWVISSAVDGKVDTGAWRFNPEIVGESLCTGDLGSHAEQMLVQFTGLGIRRVLAMFNTWPRDLPLETNVNALLDLGQGITGELWASQIAIGKDCSPHIYVAGTRGSLEWDHETPDILRFTKQNGPVQLLQTGRSYFHEYSRRLSRVASGHHEGYYEAFGNIYRSYCMNLLADKNGEKAEGYEYPDINDGVQGMKFIAACVESHRKGNIWVEL